MGGAEDVVDVGGGAEDMAAGGGPAFSEASDMCARDRKRAGVQPGFPVQVAPARYRLRACVLLLASASCF